MRQFSRLWGVLIGAVIVLPTAVAVTALANGGTFQARAPDGNAPPFPVVGEALSTYDAATGSDLWFLPTGLTWSYSQGTWTNLTASAGIPTGMIQNVEMVYDAQEGYVVLFGGTVTTQVGLLSLQNPLAETWALIEGRWTNITSSTVGSPPPRFDFGLTYDSTDQELVEFGGQASTFSNPLNDTWVYSDGTWTNDSKEVAPPAVSFDSFSSVTAFTNDPANDGVLWAAYYGSMLWSFSAGTWTDLYTNPTQIPRLSILETLTYDSTLNLVVVEAAVCQSTPTYPCDQRGGMFEFTGESWKEVPTPSLPPPEFVAGSVNDPSDGGVMIIGGCCWGDTTGLSTGVQVVWIFSQGTWTQVSPWGGNGVPPYQDDDGTWLALALIGAPAVAAAAIVSRGPMRRAP